MRPARNKAKRKQKPKKRVHEHHPERYIFAVALILAYLVLATQKHGVEQGIGITVLTWAFFVLLTPVPSADLVLEIPLRLLTNCKLVVTHVLVWGTGASLAIFSAMLFPEIFQSTTLLAVLYHVLTNPFPYWSLLFLCGLGTFLSCHLVDEVMDKVEDDMHHHHKKHVSVVHMMLLGLVLVGILLAYNSVIGHMGLSPGELELF